MTKFKNLWFPKKYVTRTCLDIKINVLYSLATVAALVVVSVDVDICEELVENAPRGVHNAISEGGGHSHCPTMRWLRFIYDFRIG